MFANYAYKPNLVTFRWVGISREHVKYMGYPFVKYCNASFDYQSKTYAQMHRQVNRNNAQGPRNLYNRHGKFRPTFKSGMEKRLFSTPLLMTWCPQKCTKLHRFAPIFSEISRPPNPQNCGGALPRLLPLDERPPSHFFRVSAAADKAATCRAATNYAVSRRGNNKLCCDCE